ncbi:MAG: LysM peptidoglycan-binding domain-containing protein [Anaerolineales bacterium]
MQRHIWLIFGILTILASACSLTAQDEETDNPTEAPTLVPATAFATQTPFLTATPRATATIAPTAVPPCTPRTDWPGVYTVQAGDTLFSIAQATNTTVNQLAQGNCINNPNDIVVGQTLRLPQAIAPPVGNGNPPPNNTDQVPPATCSFEYFFVFNRDINETRCPSSAPVVSNAAGQDFEGGRALWYQAAGVYNSPTIYVIYNDGTWESYPDEWDASLPFDDPSIQPPAERFQPVAGIGYLWRTNETVRERLGWAYEPEQPFTGRRQEPQLGTGTTLYTLYIDHGVRDLVIQLNESLVGTRTRSWDVGGTY